MVVIIIHTRYQNRKGHLFLEFVKKVCHNCNQMYMYVHVLEDQNTQFLFQFRLDTGKISVTY